MCLHLKERWGLLCSKNSYLSDCFYVGKVNEKVFWFHNDNDCSFCKKRNLDQVEVLDPK